MARKSAAIIVVCLTTLLFVNIAQSKLVEKRDIEILKWNDFVEYLCKQGYDVQPSYICDAYTTTTTTTTTASTTTSKKAPIVDKDSESNEKPVTTTTTTTTTAEASTTKQPSASALERAHWCQFKNGSYLSLGQTFIYNQCSLCQCTTSRAIRCTNLQCMSTYCIDGTTPYVREGQCCQQCGYDNTSSACVVNGIKFPHGSLLRRTTDNIQCWCQMGTVECRKSSSFGLSTLDVWGDGTAVYVIVIIIIVLLLGGVLLCCSGAFCYYYYYNRNQQTINEAYAQYYSNAGWQPMSEDGQVIADEKQAEAQAEQTGEYPTGHSSEYIPPPYALYSGSYPNQEHQTEKSA